MPDNQRDDPREYGDRTEKRSSEDELREKVEQALERARQIGEGSPLAGGQRKLLDYIIAELDTRIGQVERRLASPQTLQDFREFLSNLSDFIGDRN